MTRTVYINSRDHVWTTVTGLEQQHHEQLVELMSKPVPGAFYMPLYKLGRWNGKIPFFSNTGEIYTRLLGEIAPYIDKWGYEVVLGDAPRIPTLINERIDSELFFRRPEHTLKMKLRPYQVEAVNRALDASLDGGGIILAATGSGKTWMVAALCDVLSRHGNRCIVIVPSADLVTQTIQTLLLANLDVGSYSGDKKDVNHDVVVATWQALQNNPAVMEGFEALIVDEAHGAKAEVIGKLINKHGKKIFYRYGFTGTLPKVELDLFTIRGSLGEVIYSISAAELIEMGFMAKLEIQPVEIQEDVEEEFPDYGAERSFINRNPARLDLIADLICAKADQFGNTLVLVNSVKQGKELQKLIKGSVFLHGADENEVRAEWYHMFDERDGLIVIATFGIASTGISIDRIFCEVLVDAGKSFIRCIQSIGRGLRKSGDKEEVHLVDLYSGLKWGKKHFGERKKFYKEASYPTLKTVKMKP